MCRGVAVKEPKYFTYIDGVDTVEEWRDEQGRRHRLNGPARIEYGNFNDENTVTDALFYYHGEQYDSLMDMFEQLVLNGLQDEIPTGKYCIDALHDNGKTYHEICVNKQAQFHNLNGYATREYDASGRLVSRYCRYYISGVEYETEAEFQVAVDLYKANEIAELF